MGFPRGLRGASPKRRSFAHKIKHLGEAGREFSRWKPTAGRWRPNCHSSGLISTPAGCPHLEESPWPCSAQTVHIPSSSGFWDGVLALLSDIPGGHSMGVLFASSAVLLPPIGTRALHLCLAPVRMFSLSSDTHKELVWYYITQLLGGLIFAAPWT